MARTIFDWTLGIEAAKAYYVPPGCTAFLLDREVSRFYTKQVDANGIPVSFQSYDFTPTPPTPPTQPTQPAPVAQPVATEGDPVSRKEFDKLAQTVADIAEQISGLQAAKKATKKKEDE
jgi:hypothetical protein